MLDITQTQVQRFHGPKLLSIFSERDQKPKATNTRSHYLDYINDELKRRHMALVNMPKNPNSTWRGNVFKCTSILEYSRSLNRNSNASAQSLSQQPAIYVRSTFRSGLAGPGERQRKRARKFASPQTVLEDYFQECYEAAESNRRKDGDLVLPPVACRSHSGDKSRDNDDEDCGPWNSTEKCCLTTKPLLEKFFQPNTNNPQLQPQSEKRPKYAVKKRRELQPIPESRAEKFDLRIQRANIRPHQRAPLCRLDYAKFIGPLKRAHSSADRSKSRGKSPTERRKARDEIAADRSEFDVDKTGVRSMKPAGALSGTTSTKALPNKRSAPNTTENPQPKRKKRTHARKITETAEESEPERNRSSAEALKPLPAVPRFRPAVPRPAVVKREDPPPVPAVPERLKQKSKPVFISDESYSFVIMFGNNCGIIRRGFERRMDHWKESPTFTSIFHFKWQPFSKGLRFDQLSLSQKQMVNHFECHHEITTKDCLFRNLLAYSESKHLNVFDFVPLTFMLDVDSETYAADYERFAHCYNIIDSARAADTGKEPNHVEETLKVINQKLGQYQIFRDRKMHSKAKVNETHYAGHNIWILKSTGFNRGRGVSIFDTLDRLKSLIKYYSEGVLENAQGEPLEPGAAEANANPNPGHTDAPSTTISNLNNLPSMIKSRTFVIQKYVEKPLLIHERKFDIRVWALVTQEMRLYFFKEGYIRTSCEAYNMDEDAINKRDIHLTNNAVQKFCEHYGAFEDGNQLSFPQFQEYLNAKHPDQHIDVYGNLVRQMKDMITFSMLSVRKKLNPNDRKTCFELFGYDFLIDESFKVWLIEVNTNPCLEESSKILKMLLPRMIDDMLKLTVDAVFPRKRRKEAEQKPPPAAAAAVPEILYKVTGYADGENMWEPMCDLGVGPSKRQTVHQKLSRASPGVASGSTGEKLPKVAVPPLGSVPTEVASGDNGT